MTRARSMLTLQHVRVAIPFCVSVVLATLFFFPTIYAGLSGDDFYRATIAIIPSIDGSSVAVSSASIAAEFDREIGGFTPIAHLTLAFWQRGPSPSLARIVQLLAIILDFAIFYALAASLLKDRSFAVLAVVIVLGTFTFHSVNDAVLSTILEWPIATALLIGALFFFARALEGPDVDVRWGAGAVVIYALALLANAIAVPELLAFGAVFLLSRRREPKAVIVMAAIAACAAAELAGALASAVGSPWRRVMRDLVAGTYLREAANQAFSALPFVTNAAAGVAYDRLPAYETDLRYIEVPRVYLDGWIVILASIVVTYIATARTIIAQPLREPAVRAMIVGAAIWLAGALALGPDTLWPHGLPTGYGFPATYLERFGVGLLLAGVVAFALVRFPTGAAIVTVVGMLAIFGAQYDVLRINHAVVAKMQQPVIVSNLMRSAADAGLFAAMPRDARFVVDDKLPYRFEEGYRNARYTISSFAKRPVKDVLPPAVVEPRSPLCATRDDATCIASDRRTWVAQATTLDRRSVAVGRWVRTDAPDRVVVDRGTLYERFTGSEIRDSIAEQESRQTRGVKRTLAKRGDAELIQSVERVCKPEPLATIDHENQPTLSWSGDVEAPPKTPSDLNRAFLTTANLYAKHGKPLEMRFAGKSAAVVFTPDGCLPRRAYALLVTLASPYPATVTIHVPGGSTLRQQLTELPTDVKIPLPRTARGSVRVDFTTDSKPAEDFPYVGRYSTSRPFNVRMIMLKSTWEFR